MVMFVMERNNGNNKRTCSGLLLLNTRQSVREWKMVYKTGGVNEENCTIHLCGKNEHVFWTKRTFIHNCHR
uniref:Uncharacterized protein n=1 Tax=Octopus bimaculoides TaxID=37653 RepID=A0A0L8H6R3_OCTBM